MDQAEKLRNIIKKNQGDVRPAARVITVTSGKGGVGKSNVAVNLAVQFRQMGNRVVIFDADFGLANVEVMFGAIPKNNLSDLIYQGKSITEVITEGPMGIGFISGGSGIAGMTNLDRDHISYLIRNLVQLDSLADIIIIDTGAGIADNVLEFLIASNEVLLVTTPEPTSITDSYSLLKALNRHPRFDKESTLIKIVANKTLDFEEGRQLFDKLNVVVQRYLRMPISFAGVIPDDAMLRKAVMQQSPVTISYPNSKAAKAFKDLSTTLIKHASDPITHRRGMASFFASMVRGSK